MRASSRELLDELNARATGDDLIYRHRWRVGDLIFWDNRATMHFAQPYDDVNHTRLMHATRVVTDAFVGESDGVPAVRVLFVDEHPVLVVSPVAVLAHLLDEHRVAQLMESGEILVAPCPLFDEVSVLGHRCSQPRLMEM